MEADQGGNVTIIPDKGYAIDKVTVNGQEVSVPADGKLTGLKPTDWFYDSVKAIVEQELMNGTGSFGPDDPITREQLAAMLARFCQRER